MDSKFSKSSNSSLKYMDHVYCQANENKYNIRTSHNIAGGGTGSTTIHNADYMELMQENKHLKAMLILHLNLIQEQNDQIISKDKQIASQRELVDTFRAKNTQLEAQVQELQRQLQRHIKRVVTSGEISSVPPPPLAKIQSKGEPATKTNIIGECNGKLISKIILHRVNQGKSGKNGGPLLSPGTEAVLEAEENAIKQDIKIEVEEKNESEAEVDVIADELKTEDGAEQDHEAPAAVSAPNSEEAKEVSQTATSVSTSPASGALMCSTPPTPSRGKQMPLWHAPNVCSEDSGSWGSFSDSEHSVSPSLTKSGDEAKVYNSEEGVQLGRQHCGFLTTPNMYCTREWEDEDAPLCEYEFIKEEAEALHADAPMLEIPKWTEHELSVSYCNEGTEDLSDDTFLKRHAKLEVDERRRKKWDVQQIREQRRIEKLKRRHCKGDLSSSDQYSVDSFYPKADGVQSICFVSELPVQAFGEMVPKLTPSDFTLPWLDSSSSAVVAFDDLERASSPLTDVDSLSTSLPLSVGDETDAAAITNTDASAAAETVASTLETASTECKAASVSPRIEVTPAQIEASVSPTPSATSSSFNLEQSSGDNLHVMSSTRRKTTSSTYILVKKRRRQLSISSVDPAVARHKGTSAPKDTATESASESPPPTETGN